MRKLALLVLAGGVIVAGLYWGWRATRPKEITVCAVSDYAFRQRPNWEESIVARFREANRIFQDVKISWKLVSSATIDPVANISAIDQHRTALAEASQCKADIILSFTGVQPIKRFGSVSAFSRTGIVVDYPQESDAENARILGHSLAAFFGVPNEPAGSGTIMTEPPESDRFSPKSAALIRSLRAYNFSAGIDGLTPEWSDRVLRALQDAMPEKGGRPDVQAHRALAMALANERRMEAAIPHLREALKIDPGNVPAHAELAGALVQLSQAPEALKEITEAVRLAPNDASLHGAYGGVLMRTGDPEAGLREMNKAIEMEPSNLLFRLSLGSALLKEAGRIDLAIATFQDANRLDPNSQFVKLALERVEAQKQAFQEEASKQRQLIEKGAPGIQAYYALGNAELWAGNLDAAAKAFEKSAALETPNGRGRSHAALAVIRYLREDYIGAWKEIKLSRAGGFEPPGALLLALRRKQPE